MAEHLDLEEIERACAAATPGPWKTWAMEVRRDPVGDSNLDTSIAVAQTYQSVGGRPGASDANFIAGARQWVPDLVGHVKWLERRNNQLYGEIWDGHVLQTPEWKTKLISRIEAAVLDEREACAKLAEDYDPPDLDSLIQEMIASAIRARGGKPNE